MGFDPRFTKKTRFLSFFDILGPHQENRTFGQLRADTVLVPANPSQDYLQPQSDEDLILTSYSSKSYFVRILIYMLLGIHQGPC